MKIKYLFFILPFLFSCEENALPKPYGDVRLTYKKVQYQAYDTSCPFTFDYSTMALIKEKEGPCRFNIYYPKQKATIYITYEKVNQNLPKLIKDAEKSVYEPHTARAEYIDPKIIVRENSHVYGTLYELTGNTALNYQFHLTDSTQNFVRGAVYFRAHPNPDSLAPAIDYMGENVVKLMETFEWKK